MRAEHGARERGDLLLSIRDLRMEGRSDDVWHPIIEGISLDLRCGEVLGLIGESGAGKSSLGLAALGFVRPGCRISGGSVLFEGRDLVPMPERERRWLWGARLAYVAQSAAVAFNPAHRLIEQTIEPLQIRGRGQDAVGRAIDLYAALRLPDPDRIGERFPHQVSGGQLQRAMTAMAMLGAPDLIVFDEPTTALDVTTQVEVLNAIRGVVRRFHTAALYITHDLAVVAQMADRIMVLRRGATVEEAPTRTMLSAPREDYTKSLWSVRNLTKPQQTAATPILSLRDVEASYGAVKALAGVSLDVPRGTTVALVGESGSGKSTVARVVAGLLTPGAGTVAFQGQPLPPRARRRGKALLRQIQLIYQSADTALNPRQTVAEIVGRPVAFYSGLARAARARRTRDLVEMTGLRAEHLGRRPGELSGGQKQRVAIARALAAEPRLVICDEITSALDQVVQEEVLRLLMRLQKDLGLTYLFITHDIAVVRAIADRVVVMRHGEIVEQGPRDSVLTPPHEPYTAELLASVPDIDPDWLTGTIASRRMGEAQTS